MQYVMYFRFLDEVIFLHSVITLALHGSIDVGAVLQQVVINSQRIFAMGRHVFIRLEDRLSAECWIHFTSRLAVFTRSAITLPKVNPFG